MTGYHLQAADGEIGKLEEVYFDDLCWVVRYLVVRTGGWLAGQEVLIVPPVVTSVDEDNEMLHVCLTREQIQNAPPVNAALPVSRHYEKEYYRYYGWEPYWTVDPIYAPTPYVPEPVEKSLKAPEHPHLRSSDEIRGYHIQARDGGVGHVKDFIVEPPLWTVRYMVIDTRDWLPGKNILISPAWIRQMDWARQEVMVDLGSESMQTAPAYDASTEISRDYQVALFEHYGLLFKED